jgi:hypothetical protein
MGNPNLISEGYEAVDYVNNMGSVWGNVDFPDTNGAKHLGGGHTLIFSGIDLWGANSFNQTLSYGWSGIIAPRSLLVDLTGSAWFGDAAGTNVWPYNTYWKSGNSRIHFDTRRGVGVPADEVGRWWPDGTNVLYERLYHTGAPKLRTLYSMPDKVTYRDYNLIQPSELFNLSISTSQNVHILDLVSEGPIEGFVTGIYTYDISGKSAGDIGYTSYKFNPYSTRNPGSVSSILDPSIIVPGEARSVFWNDTPVANNDGFLNFRYTNYKFNYGSTNLHTVSNPIISLYEDRFHYDGYQVDQFKLPVLSAVTTSVNDRLYGPSFFSGLLSGLIVQKKYYVYNTDVEAIKVTYAVNSLGQTIISGSEAGTILKDTIKMGINLYRVFSDRREVLATTRFQQSNPTRFSSDSFIIRGRLSSPSTMHYTIWIRSYADSSFLIEILPDQIGWAVEVSKATEEFSQSARSNQTYISTVTEYYANRFTYPNAAMVYNVFNSKYFGEIPTRKYKMRLLKVKIPINYDPIQKNYSGAWNGNFKLAWSDNPAWCFYDIVTNNRFGLGKYIDSSLVDKWSLYEISQYCDQLVPDGYGGLEPRFVCNLLMTAREEAYKVLNDMASIFNGLVYYSAGQIFVNQDRPKDAIYTFNTSNVANGEFRYSSSSKRVRRSIAIVRFNDENNNFLPAVEYVEDRNSILKYGIREVEITSFGGTKRSQARRLGKWFLTSENLETETVNFDVGLDGNFLRPGDIINIYDQNRKNKVFAGRTLSFNTGEAILDVPYNAETLFAFTGVVNPISINFLTPTYNLNYGTYLGDLYITGFPNLVTSSGVSGINSDSLRRSQIQKLTISNPKNYTSQGTGNYTGFLKINFPSGLDGINYILPQNTVWTIDFDPTLYSGSNLGLNNRYNINNPQNLLYPGWYLEGYLNDLKAYRVVDIKHREDSIYSVTALEYSPQKYTDIVTGESLISVPTKIPAPLAPSLSLSVLYRDTVGDYGVSNNPPAYTINKTGINSISYSIIPPSNSGVVSFYNLYRRLDSNFNTPIQIADLFDVQNSPLKSQNLAIPLTTGNIPPFFTPTGTGTWYIGVEAVNSYGEKSPFVSGNITLTAQAPLATIYASGFNVVGTNTPPQI